MENSLSFDQILVATVRMIRLSWKADVCAFLQTDDRGEIHVRAADCASPMTGWSRASFKLNEGVIAKCLSRNDLLEVGTLPASDPLAKLINTVVGTSDKRFVLVPVTGEVRALGLIIVGGLPAGQDFHARDAELRSAGALCAVLAAHWRLYEWISHFLPQVNHELRTPLTAVQGSISMVLGGMFGQVGSEVREMLEMAHKGCERTVRAIEGYLNNQQPPSDNE